MPIYFGAPNVSEYIPESTYVDYRNFKDFHGLSLYLNNMTETEYEGYRSAALKFLSSRTIEAYKVKEFCVRFINAFENEFHKYKF